MSSRIRSKSHRLHGQLAAATLKDLAFIPFYLFFANLVRPRLRLTKEINITGWNTITLWHPTESKCTIHFILAVAARLCLCCCITLNASRG